MVEASVKFFYTQGFEPGLPAQVCSVITTIPLKVIRRGMNNFKLFLPASRWGLGSNLLGSPSNLAIKK
jgi:hypothetical protein